MLTKKYYKLIAEHINKNRLKLSIDQVEILHELTQDLTQVFEVDNPNFNYQRFMTACGFNKE